MSLLRDLSYKTQHNAFQCIIAQCNDRRVRTGHKPNSRATCVTRLNLHHMLSLLFPLIYREHAHASWLQLGKLPNWSPGPYPGCQNRISEIVPDFKLIICVGVLHFCKIYSSIKDLVNKRTTVEPDCAITNLDASPCANLSARIKSLYSNQNPS